MYHERLDVFIRQAAVIIEEGVCSRFGVVYSRRQPVLAVPSEMWSSMCFTDA